MNEMYAVEPVRTSNMHSEMGQYIGVRNATNHATINSQNKIKQSGSWKPSVEREIEIWSINDKGMNHGGS